MEPTKDETDADRDRPAAVPEREGGPGAPEAGEADEEALPTAQEEPLEAAGRTGEEASPAGRARPRPAGRAGGFPEVAAGWAQTLGAITEEIPIVVIEEDGEEEAPRADDEPAEEPSDGPEQAGEGAGEVPGVEETVEEPEADGGAGEPSNDAEQVGEPSEGSEEAGEGVGEVPGAEETWDVPDMTEEFPALVEEDLLPEEGDSSDGPEEAGEGAGEVPGAEETVEEPEADGGAGEPSDDAGQVEEPSEGPEQVGEGAGEVPGTGETWDVPDMTEEFPALVEEDLLPEEGDSSDGPEEAGGGIVEETVEEPEADGGAGEPSEGPEEVGGGAGEVPGVEETVEEPEAGEEGPLRATDESAGTARDVDAFDAFKASEADAAEEDSHDAGPMEEEPGVEEVWDVPDRTEEFPALVEEVPPPEASQVVEEPAEEPEAGGDIVGELSDGLEQGKGEPSDDAGQVEEPSEGPAEADEPGETPDVTTLRAAETPDAAPVDLPAAKTDLPPSYPPPRRARSARARSGSPRRRRRWIPHRSTVLVVVVVIALTALFKTFVIQWFEIPSGSMEDTLKVGDGVAVTMYDAKDLERGDVVVFTDPDHWLDVKDPTGLRGVIRDTLVLIHLLPENTGHYLIKRVIGVAGDHIVADGRGSLTVNGVPVNETYLKPGRSASEMAFDVVVPEGFIWVMGDNRSNSADSRYHQDDAHGGFVPIADVAGVAKVVVWPISHWRGLGGGHEAFKDVPEPGRAPAPAAPAPEDGA